MVLYISSLIKLIWHCIRPSSCVCFWNVSHKWTHRVVAIQHIYVFSVSLLYIILYIYKYFYKCMIFLYKTPRIKLSCHFTFLLLCLCSWNVSHKWPVAVPLLNMLMYSAVLSYIVTLFIINAWYWFVERLAWNLVSIVYFRRPA